MKWVNSFFDFFLFIQNRLEKFEKWYVNKKKLVSLIVFLAPFLTIAFMAFEMILLGEIVFIFGIMFGGIERIVGWKHSVRRWLKLCLLYNFFMAIIIVCATQSIIQTTRLFPVFLFTYMISWVMLSLIANSKVSLLVNEIMSGIAATIFTIGTYFVGIELRNLQSVNSYLESIQTLQKLDAAIRADNTLLWGFVEVILLRFLEEAFLLTMPIIGVTALCVILVKIKIYWLEKNGLSEPEYQTEEIGSSEILS